MKKWRLYIIGGVVTGIVIFFGAGGDPESVILDGESMPYAEFVQTVQAGSGQSLLTVDEATAAMFLDAVGQEKVSGRQAYIFFTPHPDKPNQLDIGTVAVNVNGYPEVDIGGVTILITPDLVGARLPMRLIHDSDGWHVKP